MLRPRIVMYHGFGRRSPERDPHHLFVEERDLERHLDLLIRWGTPLDLDAFIAGLRTRSWPSRCFLVTIDDGYESTLEIAAPLLSRSKVPAVLFVPPARLGQTSGWMTAMPDEPIMDAERLREIRSFGIEVGVHGMDHTRLEGLPPDELDRQIVGSRDMLADILGSRPRSFAYPEGVFDRDAVSTVARAGYEVAFAVLRGARGRFAIPRIPIDRRDSSMTFLAKLLPGYWSLYRATEAHPSIRRAAARIGRQRAARDRRSARASAPPSREG